MLGMDPNGPRIGKLFFFAVAREAEIVVVVSLGQLGSTGPSMWIMAIKAVDPAKEMTTLLKVEPLLVMGF